MHAILARLDTTPGPIILLRELLPFSEPAWRALLRAGRVLDVHRSVKLLYTVIVVGYGC